MNARRLGKNEAALEECRTSFEASLREAPQDEAFFLMSSTAYPHAEEQAGVSGLRLEARTAPDAANFCLPSRLDGRARASKRPVTAGRSAGPALAVVIRSTSTACCSARR